MRFSSFFQVYVEFDDQDWDKREWVKVYEDFQLFLLEHQLVWAKRKEGGATAAAAAVGGGGTGGGGLLQGTKAKHVQWPALVRPVFSIYRAHTITGSVLSSSEHSTALILLSCCYDSVLFSFYTETSGVNPGQDGRSSQQTIAIT